MRRIAQQIGRYHIMDRIAFGGMAEIFRAKTFDGDGHEQIVAIKKVLAHFAEDDEFIQMIVDEAKITSLLSHQNIAKIYEFSKYEGGYFLAMEYVDGKDLRSILDKCRAERRRLSVENATFITAETLLGLHAAHTGKDPSGKDMKIVHRDVSPSNVLVSYAGEVKLIDFGIAKASLSRVQTKTGVIKGKVKYMSPEQAMGKKLDARSDIFSAGAVLYEMLTRVPPFQATSEMDLIFKVREANFRPASEYNPKVPPELDTLITRAMARSRSQRYQSAWDFYEDLTNFVRKYRPDHRRSHLARFLKRLYYEEIEKELRALEEYVVSADNPRYHAVNLLAEAAARPAGTSSRFEGEGGGGGTGSNPYEYEEVPEPPAPARRQAERLPAPPAPRRAAQRDWDDLEPPPDLDREVDLDREPRRKPGHRVMVDPGPPDADDELRWRRASQRQSLDHTPVPEGRELDSGRGQREREPDPGRGQRELDSGRGQRDRRSPEPSHRNLAAPPAGPPDPFLDPSKSQRFGPRGAPPAAARFSEQEPTFGELERLGFGPDERTAGGGEAPSYPENERTVYGGAPTFASGRTELPDRRRPDPRADPSFHDTVPPSGKPFGTGDIDLKTRVYGDADEFTPVGSQQGLPDGKLDPFGRGREPEISQRSRFLHERTPSIPIEIEADDIPDEDDDLDAPPYPPPRQR